MPKPNIIVLVFDALTAEDMSLYGFQRKTTPNFERFAQKATVYHRHISAGNFTTPGTATLLTGVMPWDHRAIHLQGKTIDRYSTRNIFGFLPTQYHSFVYTQNPLAYILLDQFGKEITDLLRISDLAAFSDLFTDQLPLNEFDAPYEAELLSTKLAYSTKSSLVLSQLDEFYRIYRVDRLLQSRKSEFPSGITNCKIGDPNNAICFDLKTAIDWLSHQFKDRPNPFFGYIHLFPPHAPYNSRKDFIGKFEDKLDIPIKPQHHFTEGKNTKSLNRQRSHYNETIGYVDYEFGRLMDLLSKNKEFEAACVIVTSDHGEILERGISGHNTPVLYEPLVHIPLIISYPGQKIRQDIHLPTHAIDIVPTLLDVAGAEPIRDLDGVILPRTSSQQWENRDLYVVEAKSSPKLGRMGKATFALFREPFKLIYYHGYSDFDETYELYNLDEDPEETKNLYDPYDQISKELKSVLRTRIRDYV